MLGEPIDGCVMASKLYADMLEFRQQMYEGVPFAHLNFYNALERLKQVLTLLPKEDRKLILGSEKTPPDSV